MISIVCLTLLSATWLGDAAQIGSSNLLAVRYRSKFKCESTKKDYLLDSVVGWHVPADRTSHLPSWLKATLDADVTFDAAGNFLVSRSKSQIDAIENRELEGLAAEIRALVADRHERLSSVKDGSLVERIARFLNSKEVQAEPMKASFASQFTPEADFLDSVLSEVKPMMLKPLLSNQIVCFSSQPLDHQEPLPLDPSQELSRCLSRQAATYQRAMSEPLPPSLTAESLRPYMPTKPPDDGPHNISLYLMRVGYKLFPSVQIINNSGQIESAAGLGGLVGGRSSAVLDFPNVVSQTDQRVRLSARSLRHYAARGESPYDYHSGRIDKSEFTPDPSAVLVNPASADPLSFEVQEAIEDLAKAKGAVGWVANCPDSAYLALARSTIKGFVDLPTFDRLLQTDGQCEVGIIDGILTVRPKRPIASHIFQINRESLRRLIVLSPTNGRPSLHDVCEFSLANYRCLRTDLGILFGNAIYKQSALTDRQGNSIGSMSYAFLGCFLEAYQSRIFNGEQVEIPSSGIDVDDIFLDEGIANYSGLNSHAGLVTVNDLAYGLMTSQNGGQMRAQAWTETGIPVVRRVRKEAWSIQTFSNTYEGSRTVARPAGEYIDQWWLEPQGIGLLRNERAPSGPTLSADDLREKYLYSLSTERILHMKLFFPNGKISPVINFYQVDDQNSKPSPVTFDQLPQEVQDRMLRSVRPQNVLQQNTQG